MKPPARVAMGLTVLTRASGRPGKGRGQGRAGTKGRDRRYKKSIGPRGRRRNSRESARKIEEEWAGADASHCGLWGNMYTGVYSLAYPGSGIIIP
jgi:hypothetical protein